MSAGELPLSKVSSKMSGDKRNSGSSSSSGLFLTLPSNFSPSSSHVSSNNNSPRNSLCGGGGGGSATTSPSQSGTKTHPRFSPSHLHHHHHQHNYSWEDLRRLFLVSLEKLCREEPESVPFRQPVDPVALGIPDYTDIIRKPMDLSTIRNKMNSGKYTEAYMYVDDVLRMFDNAWVYNREGSKVYAYASKLAQVFQKEVNPVMYHLGYKLGRSNSFHFNSETINCHGRPVCLVMKGAGYWRDTGKDIEFNLCEVCYALRLSEEEEEDEEEEGISKTSSPSLELTSSSTSSLAVTPDVIPNTSPTKQSSSSSQERLCPQRSPSITSANISPTSCFVFTINASKSYSPAAELHKSHMRDAEMSRQLVLREFLRMLLANDTSTETKMNVFKMLRCNGKLMGEFIEYVRRRRGVVMGGNHHHDDPGGCCVVYGESFTTKDLDLLLDKLKSLSLLETPGATNKKSAAAAAAATALVETSGSGKDAISTTTSSGCSSSQEEEAEETLIELSCSEESGGFG